METRGMLKFFNFDFLNNYSSNRFETFNVNSLQCVKVISSFKIIVMSRSQLS